MNDSAPNTYMIKSVSYASNDKKGSIEVQKYRKINPADKVKDCLSCGLCCQFNFIPIDNPDDCDVAPEHREIDKLRGRLKVKLAPNGCCPYYEVKTRKCKIYDKKRPTVCERLKRGDLLECYENQSPSIQR